MESSWKTTLAQLQEYVKANPGISIAPGIIVIPSEVRDGFYALFDRVEAGFVRENFPQYLEKGRALGAAWAAASQDVVKRMGIESLAISPSLRWFLSDPVDGLARYFSDDLFAVLKGEIDAAQFETRSLKRVPPMFTDFFTEGYRRWVSTAVLGRLEADKAFRIPAVDEIADPLMGEGHENPGQRVDYVPEAQPATAMSFQQHPTISFVTPKALVWSAKLGRYAAIHSDFVEPFWTAREVSENVEWLNFTALKSDNGVAKIRPDLKVTPPLSRILPDIVVYTSENLGDLVLVADHARIARPDLAVEVMEEADWFEKGKMAAVKLHHRLLKPRYGTFIICRETPPQAAFDELAPKPPEAALPVAPAEAVMAGTSVQTGDVSKPVSEAQTPVPTTLPEVLDIHIIEASYDVSSMDAVISALSRAVQPV